MIPGCLMNNIPPAWNGLIFRETASAPPCTYTVGVLYLSFVCLRRFCSLPTQNGSLSKSSAAPLLSMSSMKSYMGPKKPRKNCSKKPENNVVMVADWLRSPCYYGGGLGSWHKSTRDPHSPGVNHPHDQKYSPFGLYPQDAPRGNFVVICEMTNIISPNAASWQAPLIGSTQGPIKSVRPTTQKRKPFSTTLSYSILSHAG